MKDKWRSFSLRKKVIIISCLLVVGFIIAQTNRTDYTTTTKKAANTEQRQNDEQAAEKLKKQKEAEAAVAKSAREQHDKNTFLEDDKSALKEMSSTGIKSVLKAPSTAKFQGSFMDPYNGWGFSYPQSNIAVVSSVVDSENSFGAMLRSEFSVTVCKADGKLSVMNYTFDGKRSSDYQTPCS